MRLKQDGPFVLLENRLDPRADARLFEDPVDIICCGSPEALEDAFARLERGLALGLHAAGFLAYELGYALEPRLAPLLAARDATPLLWMGLFRPPQRLAPADVDAMFAGLAPPPPITEIEFGHTRPVHMDKVDRVLELIRAGDIYQANLTFPIRFRYDGDPLALYAALRARQPAAHGGMVSFADATVVSVSPELFLRVADGHATSRPMKGTTARLPDADADATASRALVEDPKQRAENLMIVDLIRNDLSRIAAPGSVRTPRLFEVEHYPSFHALTSTVVAQLTPGVSFEQQMAALFPCGSIVGAPKIRAAEILAGLEGSARGVYTGAIGALSPDGGVEFNVAIRTAVLDRHGLGSYGVGGGVVADSDPGDEYDEALLKAHVLLDLARPYQLIETFRWSARSGYGRLTRHLDRLASSAAALLFGFDRAIAMARLAAAAAGWAEAPHDRRVRMVLSRDGALAINETPAPPSDTAAITVGVARQRVDTGDPFLGHKTSRRDHFDRAFAEASAAGLDEVLMLNQLGQVADASHHSVFAQIDGHLVTPPLAAGALPGVLRSALLENGDACEGALFVETLKTAQAIFLGNSLRGLRRAELSE